MACSLGDCSGDPPAWRHERCRHRASRAQLAAHTRRPANGFDSIDAAIGRNAGTRPGRRGRVDPHGFGPRTGDVKATLTRRQREIVALVAEGKTNAEIARQLWISPGTVRRHLENVFAKLDVHTRTGAVARFNTEASTPA